MFSSNDWPTAIIHVDGDAFFASVLQAVHPSLRGKPIAVGRERGICTAISYEARAYGVTRGMRPFEIKKICPQCIIVDSDYGLYESFSQKMFSIMRRYTPLVEEYSIDEGFADISKVVRDKNLSHQEVATSIKEQIEDYLNISVSVGVSLSKTLAKLASSYKKPSAVTVVSASSIEEFLKKCPIEDVWGIGRSSFVYMKQLGIKTAYDFTSRPEVFVKKYFHKPYLDIWQELQGSPVSYIDYEGRGGYKSMGDTRTFAPTVKPDFLWGRLLYHIESVFKRARKYNYTVGKIYLFLKTQKFMYHTIDVKLPVKTMYPYMIHPLLKETFTKIYKKGTLYRAAGCYISDFSLAGSVQESLFVDRKKNNKIEAVYPLFDKGMVEFGTSLFLHHRVHDKLSPLPFLEEIK